MRGSVTGYALYGVFLATVIPYRVQSEAINIVGLFEAPPLDDQAEVKDNMSCVTTAPQTARVPVGKQLREDYNAKEVFAKAARFVRWNRHMMNITLNTFPIETYPNNVFYITQDMCEYIQTIKVATSLGMRASSLRDYMQELSNRKSIPYFEIMPSTNYSRDMVFNMHPEPKDTVTLLQDMISKFRWKDVLLVYEDQSALQTYLKLLVRRHSNSNVARVSSHHLVKKADYTYTIRYIHETGVRHLIIDCSLSTITPFLYKALEMQMLTAEYHYHFTSLDLHVLDLSHFSFGGANITWSQIVNKTASNKGISDYDAFLIGEGLSIPSSRTFYYTTYNALIVDSLIMFTKALTRMKREMLFNTQSLDCDDDKSIWKAGANLKGFIKAERESYGITGNLQFEPSTNTRVNYTISLMQLEPGGEIRYIGLYTKRNYQDAGQLVIHPYEEKTKANIDKSNYYGRVLNVTTVAVKPFFMNKTSNHGEILQGNDRFEGFVVDLMAKIAEHLPIRYQFNLVEDNQYGVELSNGSWNGMVQEVITEKADLAVAPLTINYDREQVIDFTKPFMTFGIAILYKKPEKEPPEILSFLEPINEKVWGTIIVSVVVVSFSMYLFSRFSPHEWENPFPCNDEYQFMENQFSMSNAFWFSVGSIMQQGSDIMPKAPSTRIVAIAWWLFTLIIISSYTANLAAFLTITTLSETFTDAESLEKQDEVQYGCMKNGNTCRFFEKSGIATYTRMWRHMNSTPGVLVKDNDVGIDKVRQGGYAFLMESPQLQYVTVTDDDCQLRQVGSPLNSLSYGIGLRENQSFRDDLSNVILRMNENQDLLTFYNKWWKVENNKCNREDGGENDLKLRLPNLEGIFVFLMGGLALGYVILCIEILIFTVHRSKVEKQPVLKILGIWLKNSIKGKFPNTISIDSLENISNQDSQLQNGNQSPHLPGTIIEEAEPLNNGHVDGVPASTTTDTFI